MLPTAPYFSMEQLADLEAVKGLLQSVGLRAVVNPLYECGETVELVRPRDPNLALWILNATASGQLRVTDCATDKARLAANLATAAEMVVAVESGDVPVCA